MAIRLKTKLKLGLVFLFLVILAFGIMGIFYINRLSNDATLILKDNHISLAYCNNMLKSLEQVQTDSNALKVFETNLRAEENNITEIGEGLAANTARKNFESLKHNLQDTSYYANIRNAIYQINDVNQQAIVKKNAIANATAEQAKFWITVVVTILTIVTFTFIINFPSIISNPIRALSDGIVEIANKNYNKRIYLEQKDEFGDLANAFNNMASRLDEYEHSSLAKIMFEKSRIETIINKMKDGIIGLDDKRNVLFLNEVAETILNLKQQDIVGKYAPDIALNNDLMRTLLQESANRELKIYADGKESYFSKETLQVKNEGIVIGEVIVLSNITLFHELDIAKTNFIATVSHELKTPISSIKMSTSLLEKEQIGTLNNEQKDLLHSINDDADRLLKITGELLNMAQVETGNIQLKLQEAVPHQILNFALQAIQFQAQEKNIRLNVNVTDNLPHIQADAEKTSWVLINLLTNAIKFSFENSKVDVSVQRQGNSVVYLVKDYGIGIEEKYLSRVFDRYFKVPGNTDKKGTGLGLAISKEFVEVQGGAIWVNSNVGMGSEFGFSLAVANH
jgi:signal transduction histidine kinase